jgi:predicted transcriptional regulator|tara:strand:- start:1719 stop:1937 length:219 start_codon:yes stop_codon:yes gene_type:complete
MESFNKNNDKHILIKNKLLAESKRLKYKITNAAISVSATLPITHITVRNYMKGNIKDGYLAEAILAELKKIK